MSEYTDKTGNNQQLLSRPEAMIFDMDGTLLETETLLRPVHIRVFETLRLEGLYTEPEPPVERFLSSLGMILDDLWRIVMPGASKAAMRRADDLLLQYELEELDKGKGQLYPEVAEVLAELKNRGTKLFVASNGLEGYVKGVASVTGIAPYFDGLYSAGEFQTTSKVDLVARLLADHDIKSAWMVGDRSSDVEAGHANGLVAIGCAYADYGEADEIKHADRLIHHFSELLHL